jgi:hypothetical protein
MPDRPIRGLPCPVLCIETGKTYPSISAAARAAGVYPARLRQAIANKAPCSGYHWQLQPTTDRQPPADHPWHRLPVGRRR